MKALVLRDRLKLELCERNDPEPDEGEAQVRVAYCSVCRTDAKMWRSGHRDLVMPRILGHEISGYRGSERVALWPGRACGNCSFCIEGRENLCSSMRILGFHHDGGFAEYLAVPVSSLLPVPATLSMELAALAEPLGCALHALDRAGVRAGERVVIYGGGTLGLFLALGAGDRGALAVLVEAEGQRMLGAAGERPYLVALQVGGKALTTEQLARWLEDRAREGDAPQFCIGGPDGLAPGIDAQARLRWSLSALTLPHGLARVVVAEALYRAVSLIKGLPYHRA